MHKCYFSHADQAKLLAAVYEWNRREPGRNRDIRLRVLDVLDPSDDVIDLAKQLGKGEG